VACCKWLIDIEWFCIIKIIVITYVIPFSHPIPFFNWCCWCRRVILFILHVFYWCCCRWYFML
jgi:hypothetical protein